jgi:hypothetical protein
LVLKKKKNVDFFSSSKLLVLILKKKKNFITAMHEINTKFEQQSQPLDLHTSLSSAIRTSLLFLFHQRKETVTR